MRKTASTKRFVLALTTLVACSFATPGRAVLLGQWNLNEGSGTVAQDATANNNDGTLSGSATLVTEVTQGLVSTSGATGGVNWGDVAAFDGLTALSLAVWVNPTALPTGLPFAETILLGENVGSYAMSYYQNGNAYFYINGGGNSVSTPLTLGEQAFIVGTWDGIDMRIYKNGIEVGTRAVSVTLADGGSFVGAGGTATGFNVNFNGKINEAAIYNNALTGAEVTALFNAGPVPIPEPGAASLLLVGMGALILRKKMRRNS